MSLAEWAYAIASSLPSIEKYALADQIRRCSISIPSNIAEGQKRLNRRETIQFAGMALGSAAELEAQLLLCKRLYGAAIDNELEQCQAVSKMLTSLIGSLRSKL